jgi:hypothetical protein
MRAFSVTVDNASETFNPGTDFADGESRQHWTFEGVEKLIRLGLWRRCLDRRGTVLEKPPAVERVRRLPGARPIK